MTRRLLALLVLAAAAVTLGCGHSLHVEPRAFAWSGTLPAGSWIHIRNTAGAIDVVPGTGPQVEITAEKRWHRNGDAVHFAEQQTADGILVCTMYGSGGDCSPDNYPTRRRGLLSLFTRGGTSDATVRYQIRVPPGLRVDLHTVDGHITAAGSPTAVVARSVNGSVTAQAATGPVSVRTVNGSVTVIVDAAGDSGSIDLKTVNGSVRAEVPAQIAGMVDLQTVNGSVLSGFPLAASSGTKHHLEGVLGTGSPARHIQLETVNGDVALVKHS